MHKVLFNCTTRSFSQPSYTCKKRKADRELEVALIYILYTHYYVYIELPLSDSSGKQCLKLCILLPRESRELKLKKYLKYIERKDC